MMPVISVSIVRSEAGDSVSGEGRRPRIFCLSENSFRRPASRIDAAAAAAACVGGGPQRRRRSPGPYLKHLAEGLMKRRRREWKARLQTAIAARSATSREQ